MSNVFREIADELSGLADDAADLKAFLGKAISRVLDEPDIVRACVRAALTNYYEHLIIRGAERSTREGTRKKIWDSTPSTTLIEGHARRAYGLLDMPLEHGRKMREYLPIELDEYGATEIRSGKTRFLRGKLYRLVAKACVDQDKVVGLQVSEEVVVKLRDQVIASSPEPDIAKALLEAGVAA